MVRKSNLKKIAEAKARVSELQEKLADVDVIADQDTYQKLAKEFADLTFIVESYDKYEDLAHQAGDARQMAQAEEDEALRDMALAEVADIEAKQTELAHQINEYFNPQARDNDRDVIMEVRAGTGGIEASLFAGDLFRMYSKYAAERKWKVDMISLSEAENNGVKEAIFSISGKGVWGRLKWESGTHRVQRVPVTEASGRIHTSAATVAVLPEAKDVDIAIDPKDLKIDVFRSSGPGGQSVNTTDSAIRITHLPTNTVVICQDERSQLKNKHKAMKVLRARLFEHKQREQMSQEAAARKAQVGTGDRSEKIRTYNFPEHRVTDHRIGFTIHQLSAILEGDLDPIIEALSKAEDEMGSE